MYVISCRLVVLLYCGVCLAKTIPVQVPNSTAIPPAPDDESHASSESSADPFVQDEDPLLESLVGSFTLDAVQKMTASITYPHTLDCNRESKVKLDGNMDCLISYWNFQPFSSANYSTFVNPQRSECVYDIGYEECYSPAVDLDLTVTSDPSALVDGDPDTVWAGRVEPGVDTEIVIQLDSVYEVMSLDLLTESVPIDVSVQLQLGHSSPFSVARVKQTCKPEDGTFCQDFLLMDRKYHGMDWLDESESSEALRADKVVVTLHGETSFGSYSTNYHVIRDIRLLAKPTKQIKEKNKLAMIDIIRLLRLHQMNMQSW